jgi:hypothetical protein
MRPRLWTGERTASRGWDWLILASALVLALVAAADHAGSWNDGSRLATVESLVDHHTWAIDDSVFVAVPPPAPGVASPYPPDDALLMTAGTKDKLWIDGHYYSDKSPVPALLLAGEYLVWQAVAGKTVRTDAAGFCKAMALGSSGLAFALAVWGLFRLGGVLKLTLPLRLGLTASFACCTIALPYVRYVNNHILLLVMAMGLLVELAWLARGLARHTTGRLLRLGALAGLAYVIDLGAGPVLFAGTLALVTWRCRSLRLAGLFLAAALPWLALHHGLNYLIGGTLAPANAVPEYFRWPGCPFNQQTMTGVWNHHGAGAFLLYALDLLFGKRGFLGHDLPLLLLLPALPWLLRRSADRPEALLAVAWCGGVWLAYAATSRNLSGVCCSIRWFVPLLAPGYYLLAVLLRDRLESRRDFVILSGWGAVMGLLMGREGAWMTHLVPGYWLWYGGAVVCWATSLAARRRTSPDGETEPPPRRLPLRRAA